MKRVSIILVIVGLVLLIGGNFFYKTDSNSMDTAGTREVTKTTINNNWAPKIPVFMGGVCLVFGIIFYVTSRNNPRQKTPLS